MASKVQICNEALQNIGGSYITSLTENTQNAIECNLRFDSARRTLLEMHPWNFAMRRVALNKNVSSPAVNFANEFTLPSDFLYLHMTDLEERYSSSSSVPISDIYQVTDVPHGNGPDYYKIEGNKLISNRDSIYIVYVADIEDTQEFSATFSTLLSRYLGALIAYKVVGNASERTEQMNIFKQELMEYQAIDSQQGSIDVIQVSEYLAASY